MAKQKVVRGYRVKVELGEDDFSYLVRCHVTFKGKYHTYVSCQPEVTKPVTREEALAMLKEWQKDYEGGYLVKAIRWV